MEKFPANNGHPYNGHNKPYHRLHFCRNDTDLFQIIGDQDVTKRSYTKSQQ